MMKVCSEWLWLILVTCFDSLDPKIDYFGDPQTMNLSHLSALSGIYIPPLYFRLICYSSLKMQKHKVLAFRLFFLAGSRAAQEGICYCLGLPSTAQPARP